jgi:protein-tyrosine phosphatase
MDATIERRINLQGTCNFRDIGGYPTNDGQVVRWKRLYRSDALHGLTEQDLELLGPLGVATMIDLRSLREFETSGPSPLASFHGARHHHLPFLPESTAPASYESLPPLSELYVQMIEGGSVTIRSVFDALADSSTYPAVVHCAVGKDRTGVTIALLLRILGVADRDIIADYALSDGFLAEGIARLKAQGKGADLDRVPAEVLRAHAKTMTDFLTVVDTRFGGANQILTDAGVPTGAQTEIRILLFERA